MDHYCASVSQAPTAAWPRLRRTLVALTVFLAAVTVLVLTSRHPSRSVAASERQLREGYLEPLGKAGLAIEVLDTCHYYRFSAPDPEKDWHFSVKIAVSASPHTVAQVLRHKTGAVITDDRTAIGVQQYRGEPNRGWNGGIADANGGTIVSLVKNNIATSERSIPIGWQSICPETRPT